MIHYALQETLSAEEASLISETITAAASQLRVAAKQQSLDELSLGSTIHEGSTTLLSIGDPSWHTKFLSRVSPILRKHHEIVLAHINLRTQKIPVRQLRVAQLKIQLKRDLATVAARKIIEVPVFSCGPYLFIDTIELVSSQTSPTQLYLQAQLEQSRYDLSCPGTTIRIAPLTSQGGNQSPVLQLHILQAERINPSSSASNQLFELTRQKVAPRSANEDILHIPISHAKIRAETHFTIGEDGDQRTERVFTVETLPWSLRMITAKSSPRDID